MPKRCLFLALAALWLAPTMAAEENDADKPKWNVMDPPGPSRDVTVDTD